jgi:ABC-type amino acid transport substrate-binding protein
MAPNSLPLLPSDGWQQRLLPVLAELASEDDRIADLRVHGSASGEAATADRWSDLDVLVIATEPATAAEELARRIGDRVAPVFAVSRSGSDSGYCVRLVLADLCRIDISASLPEPLGGTSQALEAGRRREPGDAVAEIVASFRFEAILAAVKAGRGDVLIGAHLTVQLARHVLVIAMLLRDRDSGTNHHRHGGSRWDQWAARPLPARCITISGTGTIVYGTPGRRPHVFAFRHVPGAPASQPGMTRGQRARERWCQSLSSQ